MATGGFGSMWEKFVWRGVRVMFQA